MIDNIGVHVTHCCKWHGCKYGDPDCPVASGEIKQEYLCDYCDELLEEEDYYKQQVINIEEIKKFKKEKRYE